MGMKRVKTEINASADDIIKTPDAEKIKDFQYEKATKKANKAAKQTKITAKTARRATTANSHQVLDINQSLVLQVNRLGNL